MIFSVQEKRQAIEREIALRRRVFPNRVLTGRMKQAFADMQIRIFEEILEDYIQFEREGKLL